MIIAQWCPTFCDPMDCSLPDSSVHGILQARIVEWVAMPFSRGFSQPRDQTDISRQLSTKELLLLNCGAGEDSWESLGLQGDLNQSILKEINPEYSLEGPMLKLKLQYSGHLMQRANSLEKTLILGKIVGKRRRGQQRIRWLNGIINSMDMGWANSGR